jgi:hypothetical protein
MSRSARRSSTRRGRSGWGRRCPTDERRRLGALSGAAAVVLFLCGLLFGDLLGSSNYPPLNASAGRVHAYFSTNAGDVRLLAFFHTLAALALLGFGACLHRRLRERVPEGPHAAAALTGTCAAACFLLLSALSYRTLVEPSVLADTGLAHALVVLSYLAGGPGIAVPLALPLAAGLSLGTGRALRALAAVAAVFCVVSSVSVLGPMNNSSAAYGILLVAAVLGFAWTFLASVWLAWERV